MQFVSWKDLVKSRGTSVSTEKRRVKNDPRHPKPVDLSPDQNGLGRKGFVKPETDEYDLLLIAERDKALAENGENKPADASETPHPEATVASP